MFMEVAITAAKRSKDPVKQVGCCIVDSNKHIISTGYNGLPNGCSDDEFPWSKGNKDPLENKHLYVVHAELNAILNCNGPIPEGSTLYVTLNPCNECAKAIIQSGIKNVIYKEKDNKTKTIAADKMFKAAGVKVRMFDDMIG